MGRKPRDRGSGCAAAVKRIESCRSITDTPRVDQRPVAISGQNVSCKARQRCRAPRNSTAPSGRTDSGIFARVSDEGGLVHLDWRIHTFGPERRCLYCLGALRRSDVALDREGLLDDPDYIANLPAQDRELIGRRNVFAFSLAVASHQTMHLVGLVTGLTRVGGIGPQHYAAYPGRMTVERASLCDHDCDIDALTASALDLSSNVRADEARSAHPSDRSQPKPAASRSELRSWWRRTLTPLAQVHKRRTPSDTPPDRAEQGDP